MVCRGNFNLTPTSAHPRRNPKLTVIPAQAGIQDEVKIDFNPGFRLSPERRPSFSHYDPAPLGGGDSLGSDLRVEALTRIGRSPDQPGITVSGHGTAGSKDEFRISRLVYRRFDLVSNGAGGEIIKFHVVDSGHEG